MLEGVLAIGGVFVGAVSGVLLERFFSNRAERRQMRRDVLRRLAAHRYVLTKRGACPASEFWAVLNEVVAFIDDRDVMEALRTFSRKLSKDEFRAEHIAPLMQAMALAAKLPAENLDSVLVQRPFVGPCASVPAV